MASRDEGRHRRRGMRPRAGATDASGYAGGRAEVVFSPKQWSSFPRHQQHPGQHFFVEVVNDGRAGVWVHSVGFSAASPQTMSVESTSHGTPEMPTYLEAGQTLRWRYPLSLVSLVWESGATDADCVHAVVTLGTGESIRTNTGARVGLGREAAKR